MKSNHHNSLKKALSHLPEYEPGHEVWQNISNKLTKANSSWLAKNLPVYEAPELIWESISAQLEHVIPTMPSIRKIYRYAAILIGAALGGFVLLNQLSNKASQEISFSVETINNLTNSSAWENDEAAFALLDQFCESKGYSCKSPEFVTLKSELDELNLAHTELKSVLTSYNEDPVLLEQLTQIERQRTDLLKTLFAKI